MSVATDITWSLLPLSHPMKKQTNLNGQESDFLWRFWQIVVFTAPQTCRACAMLCTKCHCVLKWRFHAETTTFSDENANFTDENADFTDENADLYCKRYNITDLINGTDGELRASDGRCKGVCEHVFSMKSIIISMKSIIISMKSIIISSTSSPHQSDLICQGHPFYCKTIIFQEKNLHFLSKRVFIYAKLADRMRCRCRQHVHVRCGSCIRNDELCI